MIKIILASGSAARRQLLEQAGIPARACKPVLDETLTKQQLYQQNPNLTPQELAIELARAKAVSASNQMPGKLIIGGDQVLSLNGKRFDKPQSIAHAREQLRALRGNIHHLETALACVLDGALLWETLARPALAMRAFSDSFLEEYLRQMGESVTETVGAYKLEGLGVQLFEKIEGDYFSILGLPLLPLLQFLRREGHLAS